MVGHTYNPSTQEAETGEVYIYTHYVCMHTHMHTYDKVHKISF